jgi:hypothetical protein
MFDPEGPLATNVLYVGNTHACYCGSDWDFRKSVSQNSILTKEFNFLKYVFWKQ